MTTLAPVATRRHAFTIDGDNAGIPLPGFRLEIWVERPGATGKVNDNVVANGKVLDVIGLVADHVDGIFFTGRLVSLEEHFGREPKETYTPVTGFFRFREDRFEHRIEMPAA